MSEESYAGGQARTVTNENGLEHLSLSRCFYGAGKRN